MLNAVIYPTTCHPTTSLTYSLTYIVLIVDRCGNIFFKRSVLAVGHAWPLFHPIIFVNPMVSVLEWAWPFLLLTWPGLVLLLINPGFQHFSVDPSIQQCECQIHCTVGE